MRYTKKKQRIWKMYVLHWSTPSHSSYVTWDIALTNK